MNVVCDTCGQTFEDTTGKFALYESANGRIELHLCSEQCAENNARIGRSYLINKLIFTQSELLDKLGHVPLVIEHKSRAKRRDRKASE